MADAAFELVPLANLLAGQSGVIGAVLGAPEQVHRLHEIGLRDGSNIEMIQPGRACIVRLLGHTLCFRADELVSVLVRPGAVY